MQEFEIALRQMSPSIELIESTVQSKGLYHRYKVPSPGDTDVVE
jgi:hypothetical protein